MVFIYILQLDKDKYYIGKTNNPDFRLEQHRNSNGSTWTKKYKPISVIDILPNCDDYDEDKYTIKYMEKYGVNNVRGGSFCEIKLSNENIMTLKQMIRGVTDKCYICGNSDHFAKKCKNYYTTKEKVPTVNLNEKCDCTASYLSPHRRKKCILNKMISYFDDEYENIDKLVVNEDICTKDTSTSCFRCGRHGHYISSCYATKHINGYYLKKNE